LCLPFRSVPLYVLTASALCGRGRIGWRSPRRCVRAPRAQCPPDPTYVRARPFLHLWPQALAVPSTPSKLLLLLLLRAAAALEAAPSRNLVERSEAGRQPKPPRESEEDVWLTRACLPARRHAAGCCVPACFFYLPPSIGSSESESKIILQVATASRVLRPLFSFQKILQNFSDSPSHRIFRRMHEVLNIDENKN